MNKVRLFKIFIAALFMAYFLCLAIRLDSGLEKYILLSTALFSIGVYGLLASRNIIRVLMSIEILLNAANINLVAFSSYSDPLGIKGQIFAIFVMAIAACEAAIALAIILAIYRSMSTIDVEDYSELKW